jgi:hypothetical protein
MSPVAAPRVLHEDVENLSDETRGADDRLNDAGCDDDLALLLGKRILSVGHVMVDKRRETEFSSFAGAAHTCHSKKFVQRRVELVDLGDRCGRFLNNLRIGVAL